MEQLSNGSDILEKKTTTEKENTLLCFADGTRKINLYSWVKLHRSGYFWSIIKLLEAQLWKSSRLNLTCSLE